jgi:hypothetical protein
MKNTILAVFAALSMFAMQEAAAFVWCDHYTLCYSEEIPEDGPEVSAVGQSVPPPVELTGFKVYHL